MRVKLTIFVLSVFLLGVSLFAPKHRSVFSNHPEVKITTEIVSQAVIMDEDFIWKKSSAHVFYVIVNLTLAKAHASQGVLKTLPYFSAKTVKYYLLYRVLRN
ncbi:hypothetical protein [Chryseolinea sp. H1M3-3]|uniref:hypothetical protein n=1 Tax=Chryseolinea sp. H1M3-3 TaxID=3034144 RepID=UPI0023EE074E|nr:hypothetical protein [Chryseolinea sp. H1M3-3]